MFLFFSFWFFSPSFSLVAAYNKAQSSLGMAREMAEKGQGQSQGQRQAAPVLDTDEAPLVHQTSLI